MFQLPINNRGCEYMNKIHLLNQKVSYYCKYIIVIIIIFLACCNEGSNKYFGESIKSDCNNNICLNLKSEKNIYTTNEKIKLYVTILNKTNAGYLFYKIYPYINLQLTLYQNDKELESEFILPDLYLKRFNIFMLNKNEYSGHILSINNSLKKPSSIYTAPHDELYYPIKSGKIIIKVKYIGFSEMNVSSISKKFGEDINENDYILFKDTIESNQIEIDIK